MKRKTKLILTGFLAIVYIIVALNFHKIKFAFSMFKLYSEKNKTEFTMDNKDGDNIKLVVDNPLESILSQVDNDEELLNQDNGVVDNPVDNQATSVESNKNKEIGKDNSKKSYNSIINEYNTQLEDLRDTFEGELDDLIAQGIKDYTQGDLSTSQLATKYLSTGAELEKVSDAKFNSVVKNMEKELKKNGHDTAITKEVKNYYHDFKDAKKTDLINRGMKHVN